MAKKIGCLGRIGIIFLSLMAIGGVIQFIDRPKIEGNTAYVKMDLYLEGAAKNKEWAEKIWSSVNSSDEVEKVIILAEATYKDSYGNSEDVEAEIDITEFIAPLSEVRKYTQSKFADVSGDLIVEYVSMKMQKHAN